MDLERCSDFVRTQEHGEEATEPAEPEVKDDNLESPRSKEALLALFLSYRCCRKALLEGVHSSFSSWTCAQHMTNFKDDLAQSVAPHSKKKNPQEWNIIDTVPSATEQRGSRVSGYFWC